MRSPQFTVAQRLWIGLAILLGLFAVADLVSLDAARKVDETLYDLVQGGDERRGAGFEMRASLSAIAQQVREQMSRGTVQKSTDLKRAQAAFEQHLDRYSDSVREPAGRELTEKVRGGHEALMHSIDALSRSTSALAAARASWPGLKQDLSALLAADTRVSSAGRGGASVTAGLPRKEIEARLRSTAELLVPARGPLPRADLDRLAGQFDALVRHARRPSLDSASRLWLEAAQRWHDRAIKALLAHRLAADNQQRLFGRFDERRAGLDRLLSETVQPAARADLESAVQRASSIAHDANTQITRSLVVALLLGAAVAYATVRAVRGPLRRIVASSRELAAGNFARRVSWSSKDELGELADAFDAMAEKLQRTTVSRAYLEGVVNSVSDALFVVSERGLIQTANPAMLQLLGKREAELVGEPVAGIAEGAQHWLEALDGAPITGRQCVLRGKDGVPVPVLLSAVCLRRHGGTEPALVCMARDLRERIAAERHQRQTEVVFENTREALILTDAKFLLSLANPAFDQITGHAGAHDARVSVLELLADSRDASVQSMHEMTVSAGQWEGELQLRRRDGTPCPVWLNASAVRDEWGEVTNYVFVLSDISEMKEVERKLDQLAHYDALTLLPNRRLFLERARMALDRAQRSRLSVALLYLDLDDFKDVNDTFGHDEGDRLLMTMAQRLAGCVRSTDTLARLGGDEFVVMLEDVETQLEPSHVAEKLLAAISLPYALGSMELRPRASIGVSLGPSQGVTVEELLKAADAAMYRAKHRGGAGFEFFSPELTDRAMEKLRLQNALRHPALLSQLAVHYQPQIELKSGRLVAAEALVRWHHPESGLLLPGQFIEAAEEAGLIALIGEWVLQKACEDAIEWAQSHPDAGLRVAVNVSAHQIRNDRIVSCVRRVLHETGLDPALLELEVTEDALQMGSDAERVLQQLKQLNVRLALDDFGSGYSSLGSLKTLPFDRLKIDRVFVRDVQHDHSAASIIRAVIAMGHNLRMQVLAEGVETEAQLAFLRENGCDEAQGYRIAPPMAGTALQAWLAHAPHRAAERHLSVIAANRAG